MSTAALPSDVTDLIGAVQYEEAAEFPVEQGYIWSLCSAVENGNPLVWDEKVAAELMDGLPAEAVYKIMRGNAIRMLSLPLAT